MLQRHALRIGQRNALLQRQTGHTHQQLHLAVLVAHILQLKIVAQDVLHDEQPVKVIGTRNGSPRHQRVAFPRYFSLLGQVVLLRVGLERTCFSIEVHFRVGTQIDGTFQRGFQIFDVDAKLVLVGSPSGVVKILVELSYICLFIWQRPAPKKLPSTYYLHALARCTQECHHRLVHACRLVSDDDSIFIRLKIVHLDDHQTCVFQPLLHLLVVHALYGKKDARQVHGVLLVVNNYLSVGLPLRFQELVVQTQVIHLILKRALADHVRQLL